MRTRQPFQNFPAFFDVYSFFPSRPSWPKVILFINLAGIKPRSFGLTRTTVVIDPHKVNNLLRMFSSFFEEALLLA